MYAAVGGYSVTMPKGIMKIGSGLPKAPNSADSSFVNGLLTSCLDAYGNTLAVCVYGDNCELEPMSFSFIDAQTMIIGTANYNSSSTSCNGNNPGQVVIFSYVPSTGRWQLTQSWGMPTWDGSRDQAILNFPADGTFPSGTKSYYSVDTVSYGATSNPPRVPSIYTYNTGYSPQNYAGQWVLQTVGNSWNSSIPITGVLWKAVDNAPTGGPLISAGCSAFVPPSTGSGALSVVVSLFAVIASFVTMIVLA
jgi:hypothetical protein